MDEFVAGHLLVLWLWSLDGPWLCFVQDCDEHRTCEQHTIRRFCDIRFMSVPRQYCTLKTRRGITCGDSDGSRAQGRALRWSERNVIFRCIVWIRHLFRRLPGNVLCSNSSESRAQLRRGWSWHATGGVQAGIAMWMDVREI